MTGKENEEAEGLLSRWSKRKLAAKVQPDEEPVEAIPPADAQSDQEPEAEDPILKANREAAEAIDVEALTYESDFGPFLKAGVPAVLKRRALRKLWSSNPVLANLDGLNDYDGDYTQPATQAFRSAWQVGRGYLTELTERLEQVDPATSSGTETPEQAESGGDEPATIAEVTAPRPEFAESKTEAPEPEPSQPRVSLRRRLQG